LLENTFSKNKTEAEFLDWSLNRIEMNYKELGRLINQEENVDEGGIVGKEGAKITTYFYNGTDVVFNGAHSHSLVYLVFLIFTES